VTRIPSPLLGVVVALALVGGGAWAVHARTQRSPATENAGALKAAHQVQETVSGTFLVATYRPNAGEKGQSNTGHACTSGATVLVRLLWKDDANFDHLGSVGSPPDGPHKALLVTADAVTGVPCLISASYAHDDPQPGEIYLYGPRKDLVSSR
jgi:hypothetical protein